MLAEIGQAACGARARREPGPEPHHRQAGGGSRGGRRAEHPGGYPGGQDRPAGRPGPAPGRAGPPPARTYVVLRAWPGRGHRAGRGPDAAADRGRPHLPGRLVPPGGGGPAVPPGPGPGPDVLEVAAEVPADAEPVDVDQGLFRPSAEDLNVVIDLALPGRWVAEYYPLRHRRGTRGRADSGHTSYPRLWVGPAAGAAAGGKRADRGPGRPGVSGYGRMRRLRWRSTLDVSGARQAAARLRCGRPPTVTGSPATGDQSAPRPDTKA